VCELPEEIAVTVFPAKTPETSTGAGTFEKFVIVFPPSCPLMLAPQQ
jgi:hypothetical protein